MGKSNKQQKTQQLSAERAALAERIQHVADADRELKAARDALTKASSAWSLADDVVTALREARGRQGANHAAGMIAATKSGQTYDAAALDAAARSKLEQAERDLAAWESTVESCKGAVYRLGSSADSCRFPLDRLVEDVMRSESAEIVDLLMDGIWPLIKQIEDRQAALWLLINKKMVPDSHIEAVKEAIDRHHVIGSHHPICLAWEQTFKNLKADAETPLPLAE